MLGEEGGKGTISARARSVASKSTPAKTVTRVLGLFSFAKEIRTPGLAFAAAHHKPNSLQLKLFLLH